MKLVEFSVKNYRSIIKKSTIQIKDKTVIIGPNNEGKSNVLRALDVAFRILEMSSFYRSYRKRLPAYSVFYRLKRTMVFNWDDDYPHSLMGSKKTTRHLEPIQFGLTFEISENERKELSREIEKEFDRQRVTLTINVNEPNDLLDVNNDFDTTRFYVSATIAEFITDRIKVCYIDTVRTASTAYESIKRLLSIETESFDESKQYQKHLNVILDLYRKKCKKISSKLTGVLQTFVPSIKQAQLEISDYPYELDRFFFFEDKEDDEKRIKVLINDGEDTQLKQKGSGIQSLIALALAHTMSVNSIKTGNFILAIEEPEAHLHPKAIHEIKKVLFDIAKRNQLIITTHSPLLANLNDIESNIIVSENTARSAQSVQDIRDTLGVYLSDSLTFADNIILVEGMSDEKILNRVLSSISHKIKNAINNGTLAFVNCRCASKISSNLDIIKSCICKVHIVLDNDFEGKKERTVLLKDYPEMNSAITMLSIRSLTNSEIEDFIDPECYIQKLLERLDWAEENKLRSVLKGSKHSWSQRLKNYATEIGHPFGDSESDLAKEKTIVANSVKGVSSLRIRRKMLWKKLAKDIEKMLDE